MFYDSEHNQYITTPGNDLEPLVEKEAPFTLPDGNILYNKRWHFYFQLLGNLSLPASRATLVGYAPGSLHFEREEVLHFTNRLSDCAIVSKLRINFYLKKKVI